MADIPAEPPAHTANIASTASTASIASEFPALPAATVPARRTRSSRFSVLLESSVDYAAYRAAYGRQFLQQQPRFDSLRDAETELKIVLHDATFVPTTSTSTLDGPQSSLDGSIMAENVALAVDWFISALVLLFDGDEPFQNPDFLRLCCMFFAAPLYENNARLVQRHLVKRAYAELNVLPAEAAYEGSLWLLLALLHLTTEFQPDTYLLCKDSGLFPLLQRLVVHGEERNLQVLAMSLMFEIAQAVALSPTDFACVTDETLLFLLDYIERMRYAESDVYNNTGTKLVLALNEQFLRINGWASMPQSPVAAIPQGNGRDSRSLRQMQQHRALVDKLESSGALAPHVSSQMADVELSSPPASAMRALHIRTASASLPPPPPPSSGLPSGGSGISGHASGAPACNGQPADALSLAHSELMRPMQHMASSGAQLRHPAVHALPLESHAIPRSRSMDFRMQALSSHAGRTSPGGLLRSASESYDSDDNPENISTSNGNGNGSGSGNGKKPTHQANRSVSSSCSPREPPPPPRQYPASTPVVAILAKRIDCCKTFTENLVFLLNRETDPATQVLILHMLHSILSDPGTSGIMYTNDMHVLIDIMLRDLGNLAEGAQKVCQAYVLVVCALLRNPAYLAARHRLSDIELCLVNLLRQSLVCAQPLPLLQPPQSPLAGSRRGSVSSSASTRHNSVASDVLVVPPAAGQRRGSGAVSPASSLSSSVSEETCCVRSVDDSPVTWPKTSRRPPPPPPPPPSAASSSSSSRSKLAHVPDLGRLAPPGLHHRRRPAPPPPPSSLRRPATASAHMHPHSASTAASSEADDSCGSAARPHRRKAPPPPPPPSRSRTPATSTSTSRPLTPHRGPAPPPPPPTAHALRHSADADKPKSKPRAAEQTGLRRQLSVKKSVSRYKRDSIRISPPPLPPPRQRGASQSAKTPVSPVIEVPAEAADDEDEEEDEDEDAEDSRSLRSGFGDSTEGRRATRKLVESALRCCHEARSLAAMRSPTAGVF
ncbi:pre-rRNA processing [Coemansia erecta]|uniref:Pre-rRNA processing n=1 Tax=Coemansia erecta TaxID=147472 RepID=A0A9W7XZM7_9FUNG|nr:pre-rRNA processing [Coemansia erecta]